MLLYTSTWQTAAQANLVLATIDNQQLNLQTRPWGDHTHPVNMPSTNTAQHSQSIPI